MQYLVHIGYPKAASTFLQNTLFSGTHLHIKPLGYTDGDSSVHKLGKWLFHHHYKNEKGLTLKALSPFEFDATEAKQDLENLTYPVCDITCLTNESWTGHPFSGGITSKIYADNIHAVIPNAKILIIIRRQEDMLLSAYADALERYYKTISFSNFLFVPEQDMVPAPNPFFFCYDGLVKYYQQKFGAKNVCVMPFEILKEQGENAFLAEICQFLNVAPHDFHVENSQKNARDYKKYAVLKKLRWLNGFSSSHKGLDRLGINIKGLRRLSIALYPMTASRAKNIRNQDLCQAREILRPYISQSNENLQKIISHDLRSLGYMLPDSPMI